MTNPSTAVLDRAFRLHLRWCPDRLHTGAVSRVWNHLSRGQPFARRMRDLDGKRIAVEVTDTGNVWAFQVRAPRLSPIRREAGWDLRVRGATDDLLRLALGLEDADTLFFHRRLSMEGDTATGVYLKNFLDALEVDWEAHIRTVTGALPGPLRQPARGVARRALPERRLAALREVLAAAVGEDMGRAGTATW
ncbi:MAG: SCP2 domain-containing protein [Thiohalorhabdus sp.]|uniref:ubiquinone anaerobic biosynthesis accessory factor UbiT n=1 Tax=Thiohalorhabdus sp. TaxID=3094134 RepID=UPI00397FFCF8